MPVRVVTDSTCDLPEAWVALYGITVIPAVVNMAGRQYLDGVELERTDYYQRLPAMKPLPTTAAPAPGVFEAAFRACGDAEVVAVHLAEKLSAMCSSARLGAEPFGGRVHVIDSGQVSMGLGFQVLAAAEAAAAGHPLPDVLAAVRSVQQRVRLLAVLDTAEYLRRGGRASAFTAAIGDLLQIKVMLEVAAGNVLPLAKLRTRARARDDLAARIAALGPLERLAVMHVACLDGAADMANRLADQSATPPVVAEVTSVIGTHAGPGTVGVAAVRAA